MLVDYIKYKGENYAVVVKANYKNKPIDFFTDDDNAFQLGMFTRKAGYKVKPHKHICEPFILKSVQEYILVKSGKLKVGFFTSTGKKFYEAVLEIGDSVLTMKGGHSIIFLEESSILEVKQGPYKENKKIYFLS